MEERSLPVNGQATDSYNFIKLVPWYGRVGELVHCLVDSGGGCIGCYLGHWLAAREMESESDMIF